jgi:hypothetical protein
MRAFAQNPCVRHAALYRSARSKTGSAAAHCFYHHNGNMYAERGTGLGETCASADITTRGQ